MSECIIRSVSDIILNLKGAIHKTAVYVQPPDHLHASGESRYFPFRYCKKVVSIACRVASTVVSRGDWPKHGASVKGFFRFKLL